MYIHVQQNAPNKAKRAIYACLVRYLCPLQRAESRSERLLAADDDVAEHGQRDRQPHRRSVRRDGEIDVEQQVDHPAGRVPVARVWNGDAVEVDGVRQVDDTGDTGNTGDTGDAVEVDRIRQVGDHSQQVGDRQRRQQVIRRRYLHHAPHSSIKKCIGQKGRTLAAGWVFSAAIPVQFSG